MSLRNKFFKEVAELCLPVATEIQAPITEVDIVSLPESAQRYLRFMGVVGRPRDWSFRMGFSGRFKMSRNAAWKACDVWQYDSGLVVFRIFYMRLRFAGLFPVIGRDTYRDGNGRMVGKLFDRFTVIDGSGPEFDIGELVTYLNDLVLLAPSMLLETAVSWETADVRSFDLALTDHGHTVKARVFIDEQGAPIDFETTDRFCEDAVDRKKLVRTRWTTPMQAYRMVDGRQLPTRGQAVWHPSEGSFPYVEFELDPGKLAFNVRPGE
jgi:hypothetical protein